MAKTRFRRRAQVIARWRCPSVISDGALRGYAVTFLIIQAYTVYFRWIAGAIGLVFGTFLAGCVTLWPVFFIEQRRRGRR